MSGIIKAVTKEGGKDFDGRLKFATDELLPGRTGYNYGYNRLTFSMGGPTPVWDRLRYFLATEYYKTDDDRNARYKLPAPRGEYAAEGKLTLQMPRVVRLHAPGAEVHAGRLPFELPVAAYQHDYRYLTEGIPGRRVRSMKSNLTVNHLLDTATVYEVKLGLFQTGLIIAPRNFAAEAADTLGSGD